MIEVPIVVNSGGVVMDDSILELDDIATTNQDIHAMIKLRVIEDSWSFSGIYSSNYKYLINILQ